MTTTEDERDQFLERVMALSKYWAEQPGHTAIERTQGVVFSILVLLDGEAMGLGPYALRPKHDCENEGEDISGSLHEQFFGIDAR